MLLGEQIHDYFAWLDNDDATIEDMPSWMGGSDWHEENGTSETWEYVLLRQASDELTQLESISKAASKFMAWTIYVSVSKIIIVQFCRLCNL